MSTSALNAATRSRFSQSIGLAPDFSGVHLLQCVVITTAANKFANLKNRHVDALAQLVGDGQRYLAVLQQMANLVKLDGERVGVHLVGVARGLGELLPEEGFHALGQRRVGAANELRQRVYVLQMSLGE